MPQTTTIAELEIAVERLHLEPGDTLVIRAPADVGIEQALHARAELHGRYPDHPVLVLHGNGWLVNALGDLHATAEALEQALELDIQAAARSIAPLLGLEQRDHLERLAVVLRTMGEANAREAGT